MFWLGVLGVMIALSVFGRGRASARPRSKAVPYRYHGMLLLVGIPGSGKTYKMIGMMVQRLAEGRHVRVNFNVRYDRVYIALRLRHRLSHAECLEAMRRISYLDTFEDFIDAVDCDVFIDEAQDVCNSADWQLFPHEVVTWFAQHRHRRCRVVMASHRFGSIHNYLRELIADVQLARPAPWFLKPFYFASKGRTDLPLLQYITVKDAEEEVTGGKPKPRKGLSHAMNLSMMALDPIIASCYDTHGGVRPSPMAAVRRAKRKDGIELELKPRTDHFVYSRPTPADTLPFLDHDEYVRMIRDEVSPGEALQLRWPSLPASPRRGISA